MDNTVSIKGTREGLTISMGEGELEGLLEALKGHLTTQGAFFRGGSVALQVGERAVAAEELKQISAVLEEHDMVLRTVVSTNQVTQEATSALGLRLLGQEPTPEPDPERPKSAPVLRQIAPSGRPLDGSKGVLVHHMIRSGQIIRHTGHVVVIGDVNAGAQVFAGGDVVIWGRLLGAVHAGSMGNNSAVICALELTPQLLRIGHLMAQLGGDDELPHLGPEVARVRGEQIVIEPWNRLQRRT